jgi:hypothetical protein
LLRLELAPLELLISAPCDLEYMHKYESRLKYAMHGVQNCNMMHVQEQLKHITQKAFYRFTPSLFFIH